MNKNVKMEYDTPKATVLTLSGLSVICASKGASVESFTEDDELVW